MSSESETEKNVQSEPEQDPDMDGGYGWVIVFAAFLLTFCTWGLNSAYAVYFAYYVNSDYFAGATQFDYSAIGGISVGVGMAFAPLVNYLQGIIGARQVMLLGNCFQLAAAILASFSVNIWQLYLTQGVLQSFGLALISLPAMTLVSQWFVKRRVLANSLAMTGSGVGGIVFNLGLQKIIEVKNVHWALRAQGIISAVLVLFAILLVKSKSLKNKVEFTLIDLQVVSCAAFWLLMFYLITCMFGFVIVLYSLADFTTSLGYTNNQGSIVAAMVQVGFCIGRPLTGVLADYAGPYTVTTVAYFVSAIITLGMWIPTKNYATAIALGLLEGVFMGTVFPTCAAMVSRLVGMAKLNISFCMLWIFVGLSALFSQLIASALTSGTGTTRYKHTAIFAGVSFLVSAIFSLLLRGYIISRDQIIAQKQDQDLHMIQIRVPPLSVFRNCLLWPKLRA
ncbi:probable transporter Mch2p [[Candida] anglica]|uniref:Probable transporter Mch2p n=1 Tax=[Candida] anglica TaxID=148631 RepID=A0ABP0EDK2_9ASCO